MCRKAASHRQELSLDRLWSLPHSNPVPGIHPSALPGRGAQRSETKSEWTRHWQSIATVSVKQSDVPAQPEGRTVTEAIPLVQHCLSWPLLGESFGKFPQMGGIFSSKELTLELTPIFHSPGTGGGDDSSVCTEVFLFAICTEIFCSLVICPCYRSLQIKKG